MAFPDGYNYKRKITIDHNKVAGNLANFPIFVDITLNASVTSSSGYDVVFSAADGTTQLSFDLEEWDNATKRWQGWVRIPSLSGSVDTDIYVYYGNSSTTTNQSSTDTWSEFVGVWFLSEPTGGTDAFKDRTANAAHLTDSGSQMLFGQAGKLTSSAYRSDVVGEMSRLTSSKDVPIASGPITILSWINKQSTINNGGFIFIPSSAGDIRLYSGGSWRVYRTSGSSTLNAASAYPTDGWARAGVRLDAAHTLTTYGDGSQVNSAAGTVTFKGSNAPVGFFQTNSTTQPAHSYQSHIFIAAKDLGDDWMATDYANQNSPSTFYTVGTEEAGEGANGISVWTGSAYEVKPVKAWDGSGWVTKPIKYWDGSGWVAK